MQARRLNLWGTGPQTLCTAAKHRRPLRTGRPGPEPLPCSITVLLGSPKQWDQRRVPPTSYLLALIPSLPFRQPLLFQAVNYRPRDGNRLGDELCTSLGSVCRRIPSCRAELSHKGTSDRGDCVLKAGDSQAPTQPAPIWGCLKGIFLALPECLMVLTIPVTHQNAVGHLRKDPSSPVSVLTLHTA